MYCDLKWMPIMEIISLNSLSLILSTFIQFALVLCLALYVVNNKIKKIGGLIILIVFLQIIYLRGKEDGKVC